LPIQAVDSWVRVRRGPSEGDLQQFGYFSGVELDPQPLLVCILAPDSTSIPPPRSWSNI
jgi:hypothetical protein